MEIIRLNTKKAEERKKKKKEEKERNKSPLKHFSGLKINFLQKLLTYDTVPILQRYYYQNIFS